jgi:hypothetical protein
MSKISIYALGKTISCSIALLLIVEGTSAAERFYIKKNETFCDSSGALCLLGSFTYRPNSRILSLNARVQKKTGPGNIRIVLIGRNRQDFRRLVEFELTIRGNYSEIIDHQMRPDAPDVSEWRISSFTFEHE